MSVEAGLALVVLVIAPLFVLWIVALFHIVAGRPDLSIGGKSIWSAIVLLLGYAGLLLYVMFRPPRPVARTGAEDKAVGRKALRRLSQLIADHDAGSISDEEFARDKAAVFGLEQAAT
ncbi:MAG: PLDc N-terminal domain-containing protein [Acidimicrobiia bacterium]